MRRGAEVIAVEVKSVCPWRKRLIGRAELVQDERLVGAVCDHRVGLATKQILRITIVLDPRHGSVVNALGFEHRREVVAVGSVHQTAALEVRQRRDAGAARHQQDRCGVLKDDAEHDQVAAASPVDQNA